MMVFVNRWSLYRGAVVTLKWPMEQPTVVTIDRWSLYRGAVVLLHDRSRVAPCMEQHLECMVFRETGDILVYKSGL